MEAEIVHVGTAVADFLARAYSPDDARARDLTLS